MSIYDCIRPWNLWISPQLPSSPADLTGSSLKKLGHFQVQVTETQLQLTLAKGEEISQKDILEDILLLIEETAEPPNCGKFTTGP